jgi:hypothetical protein
MDFIKIENDVDVQREDIIDIKADEVHTPSAFTIKEAELKVSFVLR